jgi:FeS assembly SUF system regulator
MLRLSKLTDYGTVIMTHMAREPERTYSAAGLAAALGVTAPTASKILKILVGGGLLVSLRGAKGGYTLAQPPGEISLVRIIEVMEGPFGVTECSATPGLCAQEACCSIKGNWQRINQSIRDALVDVTLAHMTQASIHPVDLSNIRSRRPRVSV